MPTNIPVVSKLDDFPPGLPNVPPNFTSRLMPGAIENLFNYNTNFLYNKFSPYTNYNSNLLGGILSDQQPFVYTTIQQGTANGGNSILGDIGSLVNITPETTDDVVRVSKFLISSWGVQFLASQALIQRAAPFDETRNYNPLSPLLATVQPLTLGLGLPPLRHIELLPGALGSFGLLGGLANSVTSTVGIDLSGGSYATPSSTVGDSALPLSSLGKGKGLIRGSDASNALTSFKSIWAPQPKGGILSSFLSSVAGTMQSFFGGAPHSPGTVRGDDTGYVMMASGLPLLLNARSIGPLVQPWYSSPTTQVVNYKPPTPSSLGALAGIANTVISIATNPIGAVIGLAGSALSGLLGNSNSQQAGGFVKQKLQAFPNSVFSITSTATGLQGYNVAGQPTGYSVQSSPTAPYKYGNYVGRPTDGSLVNSEMMVQYGLYVQPDQQYQSKMSDPKSVALQQIQDSLKQVITDINKSPMYKAFGNTTSILLPSGTDPTFIGYQHLYSITPTSRTAPKNTYGVISEYQTSNDRTPSIDAGVKTWSNLRMATTFFSDAINMMDVLPGDMSINSYNISKMYPDLAKNGWRPYKDDLIAFFFYDVVNDKYIPFRATVKAISEGGTAFWDELRFIGRADQLYSYNGFSRTLTFSFNVVINSIAELAPTWKKINYIASSIKPSNYTTGQQTTQYYNRFIVPPMFMITIGDLYKFQPIVITSVNVNIPDDAAWETLNQNNSNGWSYLNGLISADLVGQNYGQLPREAEIAITCNVLEKERAIVGGSNFGHEPRVDNWENTLDEDGNPTSATFLTGSGAFLPAPTTLHKNFVVWNIPGSATPVSTPPSNTGQSTSTSAPTTAATVAASGNPPPTATPTTFTPSANTVGNLLQSINQRNVPSHFGSINP